MAAAIGFIDEYGLPGLAMRRLREELGVEAMSLYRHLPGREDLLDAVVQTITEEMETDDDVYTQPHDG